MLQPGGLQRLIVGGGVVGGPWRHGRASTGWGQVRTGEPSTWGEHTEPRERTGERTLGLHEGRSWERSWVGISSRQVGLIGEHSIEELERQASYS
jgi:hypothetical protein